MTADADKQPLADEVLGFVTGGTGQQRGGSLNTENLPPQITADQLLESLAGDGLRDMRASSGVTDMTMSGSLDDDILTAGAGNDLVYGLGGSDQIDLGAGNDTAVGGSFGHDTVLGRDGDDLYIWYAATGGGHFDGGAGRDTLEVRAPSRHGLRRTAGAAGDRERDAYKVVDGQIVFDGPASGTVTWFGQTLTFDRVEVIRIPGHEHQLG
jgi:Ca2+-binding RTX toxin-like protein